MIKTIQQQTLPQRLSKIETKQLTSVTPELTQFTKDCEALGYNNNSNIKLMKWAWCMDIGGAWFATYDENKIISISGIHPWLNGWRALFRGVQTQARPGLSRHHMSSYCFHSQLPLQIEWAKQNEKYRNPSIYITTNTETDQSGKMLRINKTFTHLERAGLVQNLGRAEVFETIQNVWLLDIDRYTEIRESYDRIPKQRN